MLSLRRPAVLLFCVLGVAEGALIVAACSSDSPATTDGADASPDGSRIDPKKDATVDPTDSGKDAGGHCSGATGSCDIVLQDCPSGQECSVDNNGKAKCQAAQSSQSREKGQACCPNGPNQCLPGLTCVGGSACVDGGPETGRCSPACCRGDDQACGVSSPEGIAGACELGLVDENQNDLYTVCTYRDRCQPFGVKPCPSGGACQVTDKTGASTCIAPNGKTLGDACQFANDCNDGLACIGAADAGQCRLLCLTPGSVNPFDAGVEDGGPYHGSCTTGTSCTRGIAERPSWLSFCTFTDGG